MGTFLMAYDSYLFIVDIASGEADNSRRLSEEHIFIPPKHTL